MSAKEFTYMLSIIGHAPLLGEVCVWVIRRHAVEAEDSMPPGTL